MITSLVKEAKDCVWNYKYKLKSKFSILVFGLVLVFCWSDQVSSSHCHLPEALCSIWRGNKFVFVFVFVFVFANYLRPCVQFRQATKLSFTLVHELVVRNLTNAFIGTEENYYQTSFCSFFENIQSWSWPCWSIINRNHLEALVLGDLGKEGDWLLG